MSLSLADVYNQESDSADEEYIPDEGVSSGRSEEEEDSALSASDGDPLPTKRKGKISHARKRRRGTKFDASEEEREKESEVTVEDEQKNLATEIKEKERIDNLWASFKHETESSTKLKSTGKTCSPPSPLTKKKIKIQKTYDFAGEEVTVVREVDANSKEAKNVLKSEPEKDSSKPKGLFNVDAETPANFKQYPQGILGKDTVTSKTKLPGLGSVLKSLGKKTKMNTLEKSSLDWITYKQEEGLEEELARNLKDGFLEKQDFLRRSDYRQFELEKEQRLKCLKRMH